MRVFIGLAGVLFVVTHVQAQPPGRGGGFRGGPPGFALMTALDPDRDGKISAGEIARATVVLKELDKNGDGKLSGDEIGWPPSFGGGGPPFGRGGGGRGGFPEFVGQGGGRPERPDPDGPLARRESRRTAAPRRSFFSASDLRKLDRNRDGRISKDEIPRRMQELILAKADSNKDGAISQKELDSLPKATTPEQ